jgi:hypothetical protein
MITDQLGFCHTLTNFFGSTENLLLLGLNFAFVYKNGEGGVFSQKNRKLFLKK